MFLSKRSGRLVHRCILPVLTLLVLKFQPSTSFAVSPFYDETFCDPSYLVPESAKEIAKQGHPPWIFFPSFKKPVEFSSFEVPDWLLKSHDEYLKRHQIVQRRKVASRVWEIAAVLCGQILRPLFVSLIRNKPDLNNIHIPTDEDWDAFWLLKTKQKGSGVSLTNAQRVAQGLPPLGPTFVKLGQGLATRPDILHVPLADALAHLQDNVPPFENLTAKRIIRNELKQLLKQNANSTYIQSVDDVQEFMDSLSPQPVAAASMAQVYKGHLRGFGPVAVKVLRPGIRNKVERDATLFHSLATWAETLYWPPFGKDRQSLVGSIQLVQAVDEFTSRVLEDLDFIREAENIKAFAQLYCHEEGSSPTVQVVVPKVLPELCSSRVLVMGWLEGTKLTDICTDCDERPQIVQENLALISKSIEMTISMLIDHGYLHGDPHSANLLKVRQPDGSAKLGYLDFGLVSYVPQKIRDGIVCAVVQLVFARNVEAVADLCVDLGLLPEEKLQSSFERQRFIDSFTAALDDILVWPRDEQGLSTSVPKVRFEKLLPSLTRLIRGFEFTVPPYFLNNIRALATLEGMALKLDPDFNVLRVIYPYSINRLMRNPSVSQRVQDTFLDICRNPNTKLISPHRVNLLLSDWALLTGYRKRKIFWDLMTCAGGRRVTPIILRNFLRNRIRSVGTFYRVSKQKLRIGYFTVVDALGCAREKLAWRNVLGLPIV